MTRHLEYAVDLVGIEHVGISTDFCFDAADFANELRRNPHLFDASYTRWGPIQWVPPETFVTLGEHLREGDGTVVTSTRSSVATSIGWPNKPGAPEQATGASLHGSSTLLASHRPSTFSIVIFTLLRSS